MAFQDETVPTDEAAEAVDTDQLDAAETGAAEELGADPEAALGFDAGAVERLGFDDAEAVQACSAEVETCVEQFLACAPGDEACRAAALSGEPLAPEAGSGLIDGVMGLYEAGGPIIVILTVLSLISLTIILGKVVQFMALNVSAKSFIAQVGELLKSGREAQALRLLENKRGPVARVMEAAVRGRALGADEAATREEVTRVAQSQLEGMEAGLPYLSLIATISPLLGLLGTVLGMIDAFQQLEGAGDRVDPAILSGGIWEALLTTAAGLSVAIPAAAFFTWLQRTVDVVAQRMEDAATRVFTVNLFSAKAEPAEDEG
jgi:biopolymer transport protein ExbB